MLLLLTPRILIPKLMRSPMAFWLFPLLLLLVSSPLPPLSLAAIHDYGDALHKSILFFEGQRSGRLPPDQRLTWRRDSALHDGSTDGVSM